MSTVIGEQNRVLLVDVRNRVCAFPLGQVIETMRPLPVERLTALPPFVMGVAIIRGIPTPVVDLGALLGVPNEAAERFITVRAGENQVALSVSAVLGVLDLNATTGLQKSPPLLQNASQDFVAMLGTLDEKLLLVLRACWELPDEVWQALTTKEKVS